MKKNLFSGHPFSGVSERTGTLTGSVRGFFSVGKAKAVALLTMLLTITSMINAQTVLIDPAQEGGFEAGATFTANGWTTVNNATDAWALGDAADVSEGMNAAFISSDGGTTWEYGETDVVSHLYYEFTVPAGESILTLTFKWKGYGEGSFYDYDNLKVFMIPDTEDPDADTELDDQYQIAGPGANEDYGFYNMNDTDYEEETITVNVTAGETYRLVFSWKSDSGTTGNPPAAVDEVSLVSTCAPMTALAAGGITTTGFDANWTAVTDATGYNVHYREAGTTTWTDAPGNPYAGTTASISGLTAGTYYEYEVSPEGPVCNAYSNTITVATACEAADVPYIQDFESATAPDLPVCTTVENVGDGNLWETSDDPDDEDYDFTGTHLRYAWDADYEADTWFYTQGINLTSGTSYRISYNYGSTALYPENLEVAYGTSPAAADMTNALADHQEIEETNTPNHVDFTPSATGVYYFGFHAYSEADQFYLFVDDIKVDVTPSCEAPEDVEISGITNVQADISWTASASAPADGYEYEVRESGAAGSGATGLVASGTTLAGETEATATGLTGSTEYSVYVRSNCGSGDFSDWTQATEFTTECDPEMAPTVMQEFDDYSGDAPDPACWSEAEGMLEANSDLTYGYSYWTDDDFANDSDNSAKIELYGEGEEEWLISNPIDLGTGVYRLKYDMALTDWAGTDQQSSMGGHKVSVVISTDGGNTWSDADVLKVYEGPGTYSNTGQTELISLANYSGVVKIAFVAYLDNYDNDFDFFIDNFVVEEIPAPTITDYTSSVECGPFTTLTINGTELMDATVTVDGTEATIVTNTADQITATVDFAVTDMPVVVETPGGTATSTDNFDFTISPSFAISGTSTAICEGDATDAVTVTDGAADYDTYTWTPASDVSGDETTGWTFDPTATTVYTLNVVNDATGCVNSATYAVSVNPLPDFELSPASPVDACIGVVKELTLQSNATETIFAESFDSGMGGFTTENDPDSDAATNWTNRPNGYEESYLFWNGSTNNFMLANSDAGGNGSETNTQLISPSFSTAGYTDIKLNFDEFLYNDDDLNLAAAVEVSTDGTSWTVLRNDLVDVYGAIVGPDEDEVEFASTTLDLPAAFNNQPSVWVRFRFEGEWSWFWAVDELEVEGTPIYSFEWTPATNLYTDDAATMAYTSGDADTLYSMSETAGTESYTVTASTGAGCTATLDIEVITNPNPEPTITAGGPLTFCEFDNVVLTSSATTGNEWSNDETTAAITVTESGSYYVTETDANGCMGNSDTLEVDVKPAPVVDGGQDMAVCAGESVTLEVTGTDDYEWDNNVVNGEMFTPTATDDYVVTATGSNGCENTDTVTVTVNALPTVSAGADDAICAGEEVTLSGSGAVDYEWDNGVDDGVAFEPTATETYTLTGTDANGCENTDEVTITVNAVPVVTTSISADQVTIVATPAGQTYQWINCANSQDIAGATSASYTATANGSYSVEVTNSSGCTTTSSCVTINQVGLEDNTLDLGIALYPNPTSGNVYIDMEKTEAVNITVFDAQGKEVQTMTNAQAGSVIDLSQVGTGVYMVRVSNAKGADMFRIVKN